jgi:hypothetical protein
METQIKKSRDIKASSLKTYMSSLKALQARIDPEANELTNTKFLHNFNKVIAVIKDDKITSKKNRITSILVALNSDKPKDDKLIEQYSSFLKELSEQYLTQLKTQKKTETQEKNWLDYADMIEMINTIMKEVKTTGIRNKPELNNKEFDLLQQLVILRTYMAFPLRNDFADMRVLSKEEFDNLETQDNIENYLVVESPSKKEFHINQFKNQKFIGNKIFKVPASLNAVLNIWLKHNKSGWYLVKSDKIHPITPNGITKFLNKIFKKYTGKKISTSMIRHIVISYMLKDKPTIEEKEAEEKEIENKFLHSNAMNNLYRKI